MRVQDIFIIGGGINGVGIALEGARAGLKVTLCEAQDLGQETSSKSSKLIHGGLRYLEHYAFGLVKESLNERELLMKIAPHLIRPQSFIIPHTSKIRPLWFLRLGLYLYDYLSPRKLIPTSNSQRLDSELGLQAQYKKGLKYYDCTTDDTRLVVTLAKAAKLEGAQIYTRSKVIGAKRLHDFWEIQCVNEKTGQLITHQARCLVNATGVQVANLLQSLLHIQPQNALSWVKGSHIVIPRILAHREAFLLQNSDKRVIFVIPYLEKFTLIGTTDITVDNLEGSEKISEAEIHYLLDAYNNFFCKKIDKSNIHWSYSGVRALSANNEDNPSKLSRDYILELNQAKNKAPVLSVFGGKLTTFRSLSCEAIKKLKPFFPFLYFKEPSLKPLPGGALGALTLHEYEAHILKKYPHLPANLLKRYINQYGSLTPILLGSSKYTTDLGVHFGASLYEKEIRYLQKEEWAITAEDIVWRRTKLGLNMTLAEITILQNWLDNL